MTSCNLCYYIAFQMGKQYPCSYCGKILYSSQYVKKHEATHTGQKFKAVTCKYCFKTVEYTKVFWNFHDNSVLQFERFQLKNHELIHTGEKPFACSDCSYRCIQRSNLRIHMRAVHKKELPRFLSIFSMFWKITIFWIPGLQLDRRDTVECSWMEQQPTMILLILDQLFIRNKLLRL